MLKHKRDYKAEYRKRSKASRMCGWYKSYDKKHGRKNNLTIKDVEKLINLPCSYCEITPSNGVDRKSSEEGHIIENCIPSCFKCNMVLGTLIFPAKEILAPGLKKLREGGFFENWDPPNPFIKKS